MRDLLTLKQTELAPAHKVDIAPRIAMILSTVTQGRHPNWTGVIRYTDVRGKVVTARFTAQSEFDKFLEQNKSRYRTFLDKQDVKYHPKGF